MTHFEFPLCIHILQFRIADGFFTSSTIIEKSSQMPSIMRQPSLTRIVWQLQYKSSVERVENRFKQVQEQIDEFFEGDV